MPGAQVYSKSLDLSSPPGGPTVRRPLRIPQVASGARIRTVIIRGGDFSPILVFPSKIAASNGITNN
jgi:hypothetical protein